MVTITKYVWDTVSDCVLSELDENNAVTAVYTNEPQQYGGVLSQRRGTTSHYHHHDALGSTRFLTDSSGNVTDTYLYDAWGNSVASAGTTVNPFKWVGKYGYYTDDSTGQVYVRARMYQTATATYFPVPSILNSQFESKPYNSRRTGLGSFGSLLSRILSIPFLDESETPKDRKKVATCTFQICSSPVPVLPGSKQPFGHLFVICDGKAMRAGPGDKLAHQLNGEPWGAVNGVDCPCDLADTLGEQGRLVPLVGPWDPSFPDHPEHRGKPNRPRNGYPPEKLKCRDVTVSGTCADVCGCMENRMRADSRSVGNFE